jgi:putative redox protein
MTIHVTRDLARKMMHTVSIREHVLTADESAESGGEDAGPTPHDLYDSALGACKALTVLWYSNRKKMPIGDGPGRGRSRRTAQSARASIGCASRWRSAVR